MTCTRWHNGWGRDPASRLSGFPEFDGPSYGINAFRLQRLNRTAEGPRSAVKRQVPAAYPRPHGFQSVQLPKQGI